MHEAGVEAVSGPGGVHDVDRDGSIPSTGPGWRRYRTEPVRATTWTADANECIAPRIGLPQLAVVHWPEPSDADEHDERSGLHWETRTPAHWAAGRSFAWVDDEITDTDRAWVSAHHRGHAPLHRTEAALALGRIGDQRAAETVLGLVRQASIAPGITEAADSLARHCPDPGPWIAAAAEALATAPDS
ncbi:hypothetical protein [Kitasatospora sp. NPDC058218]|uniref:hypothetical protein n=1 Tax=Kitasatospora sp. NPDC058218 TaxID=3346385 RepID=UPI0036DDE65E